MEEPRLKPSLSDIRTSVLLGTTQILDLFWAVQGRASLGHPELLFLVVPGFWGCLAPWEVGKLLNNNIKLSLVISRKKTSFGLECTVHRAHALHILILGFISSIPKGP